MDHETLWRSTLLVIHLAGFGALFGTAVCDGILNVAYWRQVAAGPRQAASLVALMAGFGKAAQASAMLTLASGVLLLAASRFAYWGMNWLTVKLVLFVALSLLGNFVGRASKERLIALTPALVEGGVVDPDAGELATLRKRLGTFHVTMTAAILVILASAVLKY